MDPEELIDNTWALIQAGMFDFTPDETRASTFMVEDVNEDGVVVLANMNSRISIPRSAFVHAAQILIENNATQHNPLRIGSSNSTENSLELCLGTKAESNGTRVINYIAPILLRMGIVSIDHNRPNRIWLIQS
jgi:hypothetical protein